MKKKLQREHWKGFPEPTYTQTPNDFFEMAPDMGETELRVTLVMIRFTFGYQKSNFKMSIAKLAEYAGLSENGARAGAEAAEARGTFRRANKGVSKAAEWELVVSETEEDTTPEEPLTPASSEEEDLSTPHAVQGTPAQNAPHVDTNKTIKKTLTPDGVSEISDSAEEGNGKKEKRVPPPEWGAEWQMAAGRPIDAAVLAADEKRRRLDVATMIAMQTPDAQRGIELVMAFQEAKNFTIPKTDRQIKVNRSALKELLAVTPAIKPEHIKEAIRKLGDLADNVVDLNGVYKNASGVALKKSGGSPMGRRVTAF